MKPLKTAVLGATGIAGQQFLTALEGHPWFEVTHLAASARSAGKSYQDAIRSEAGAVQWYADAPCPRPLLAMTVLDVAQLDPDSVDVVFSALESDAARILEPRFAEKVPVLSTASAFRYEPDVPILLPGVNPEHIPHLRTMQAHRGWRGFIAPNPNCTTIGLALTLAPLHQTFGVSSVIMTSLQAISGAGRSPGINGLDIIDNIVPFIPKEEEKVALETRKILGTLTGDTIIEADIRVSATCTRVPILEGHTETVAVSLRRATTPEEVTAVMSKFGTSLGAQQLPSAPSRLLVVHDDPFRPQPRLDRDVEQGMVTSVGRIRPCEVMENGIKYVLVSHNTKMGAARGTLLMAEALVRQGYIG